MPTTVDRLLSLADQLTDTDYGPGGEYRRFADVSIVRAAPESTRSRFYPEDRYLVTKHVDEVGWLFRELVDVFGKVDGYGVWKAELFGRLANAANWYLARNPDASAEELNLAIAAESVLIADELAFDVGGHRVLALGFDNEVVDDLRDPLEASRPRNATEVRQLLDGRRFQAAIAGSVSLPLFTYGTLKPGQPAHRQIAGFLDKIEEAVLVDHALFVRDGLPGVQPVPGGETNGFLLWPRYGAETELLGVLAQFEPSSLYQSPREVDVITTAGVRVSALTHLMRQPAKGSPQEWPDQTWSCANDPLFRFGLPEMVRDLRRIQRTKEHTDCDNALFWEEFVPTLGVFLALNGVLERYLTLSQPPTSVWNQLGRLGESESGLRAVAGAPEPCRTSVFVTTSLKRLDWTPRNAWRFWYQVRSNAVHRGKGAFLDLELLATSADGLALALTNLIADEVPGIAAKWARDHRPSNDRPSPRPHDPYSVPPA